jgi:PEGA domain
VRARLVVLALLVPGLALGDRVRVAVAPVTSLTEGTTSTAALDQLVEAGIAGVPDRDVITAQTVRQVLRRAKRRDLESCEGEAACLAELGKTVGAAVVVSGEASGFADGAVVYLKAVDVASGEEIGATTLVTGARPASPPGGRGAQAPNPAVQAARAAAYRLLAPRDYTGTLVLRVDVAGATVFVDGQAVGTAPLAPLTLPVGTHALRVTHPTYRDFVRFVDVPFGERVELGADLSAYPVVADALRQDRSALEPKRPWTRSPWLLVGAGVAAAAVAAVVVISFFPPSASRDRDVTLMPPH